MHSKVPTTNGQGRLLYPAKVPAIVKGGGEIFHGPKSLKKLNKNGKQNTGSHTINWREEQAQQTTLGREQHMRLRVQTRGPNWPQSTLYTPFNK